ncbi:MAG: cobalamin biosynthesis protein [Syntrophomonadaceae bacterium]|nr:cobalamin biosynthesis protein [Syntrophomonadaceae bacterium]
MFKEFKKLWMALGLFIILCPLGLIATGTAFGEWGTDQLSEEVGFIPAGLAKFADFWSGSLLPDYGVPGWDADFIQLAGGYILSALVGVALVVLLISFFSKIVKD